MSARNLISVATLATIVEAEVLRDRLVEQGIQAVLLSEPPADETAIGGLRHVRVQVSEADFERAMGVLFPLPKFDVPAGNDSLPAPTRLVWTCSRCGEEVHAESPVCWACGAARSGKRPTADNAPDPDQSPGLEHNGDGNPHVPPAGPYLPGNGRMAQVDFPPPPTVPATEQPTYGGSRQAEPPERESPGVERQPDDEPVSTTATSDYPHAELKAQWVAAPEANPRFRFQPRQAAVVRVATAPADRQAEAAATRAWYTALIGVVLCIFVIPPFLNVYSMCVLLQSSVANGRLGARGHLKFFGALLLNAVALVALGVALSRIL